jgi:kynurenine formamidase
MSAHVLPTEQELRHLFNNLKNWGRWGPDDELGTVNLVTQTRSLAAAELVESGRVVSLAFDLDTHESDKNYMPTVHRMLHSTAASVTAVDQVTIVPHSFAVTHLDAVSHSNFDGHLYNGRTVDDTIDRFGIQQGSIGALYQGVVSRGVFLDVASARGVPWLEPGEYITEDDLDAAESLSGVTVEPGDVILVRAGIGAWEAEHGPETITLRAGLSPWCLRWLRERDVAVYGGDCFERLPLPYQRYPWAFHQIAQASIGLVLLDNVDMEPLAAACTAEGRDTFMIALAPLRLQGGTGSALNPLAVF